MSESTETKLALIKRSIEEMCKDIATFVTKEQFNSRITPLEKIVYTFVSLVLLAFVGALIALVIK